MNPLYHHTFEPWHADGDRRIVADDEHWLAPIEWDRAARESGERRRVLVACEVFECWSYESDRRPRGRLYELISDTPNLDWLIVTEKPDRTDNFGGKRDESNHFCRRDLPQRVWLGTIIRTQAEADERIPHLLRVPAAVRFVMCEPREEIRLDSLDSGEECQDCGSTPTINCLGNPNIQCLCCEEGAEPLAWHRLNLLVCRDETGPDARPIHWRHAHSLRDQCESADVPFRFDGWGEWVSGVKAPLDIAKGSTSYKPGAYHDFGDDSMALEVGSAHSGRLLDGKIHDGLPEVVR